MDRIIQSPGKYIQGAGAIKRLGDYLKPLAERWLVVGDKFVLGFAEEMLRKSLADAGLAAEIAPFGGECSHKLSASSSPVMIFSVYRPCASRGVTAIITKMAEIIITAISATSI